MKNLLIIFTIASCLMAGYRIYQNTKKVPVSVDPVYIAPVQYVGKVKLDTLSVRLLVLKHCFERMADGDAELAIEAANIAATKGLNIEDIGNFYINKNGQVDRRVTWQKYSMDQLKDFVSSQMKVKAEPGDTLVVMTIGHGGMDGGLQMLGHRKDVMRALAQAAGENNQETIWWQLSCYASAYLPDIKDIPLEQQEVFSIVASSDAVTPSPANLEGRIMQKLFLAMAESPRSVDKNDDSLVTAQELSDFLNTVERNRGSLVYAKSPNENLFGINLVWRLPIVDRNNPQQDYPKNYIPLP